MNKYDSMIVDDASSVESFRDCVLDGCGDDERGRHVCACLWVELSVRGEEGRPVVDLCTRSDGVVVWRWWFMVMCVQG